MRMYSSRHFWHPPLSPYSYRPVLFNTGMGDITPVENVDPECSYMSFTVHFWTACRNSSWNDSAPTPTSTLSPDDDDRCEVVSLVADVRNWRLMLRWHDPRHRDVPYLHRETILDVVAGFESWKMTCRPLNDKSHDTTSSLDVCNAVCFPNIHMFMTIFATLPVLKATAERSISVFIIICWIAACFSERERNFQAF